MSDSKITSPSQFATHQDWLDAQLAEIKDPDKKEALIAQDMLNQENFLVTTTSNMMKSQHDTLMEIARKLGG